MTVAELIAALQELPPHLEVEAEGCDCVNDVRGAGMRGPGGLATEPRAVIVCEPDFYGILGPSYKERNRARRANRL